MKIKLTQNDRVFFDSLSHSYLLDGEVLLPGVTELMRKYHLGADYSGIPEATLKKAAKEGTALHEEIEKYESGDAILITPFIQQYQKLGLRCIATEYLVSDNETVASKIDGVYYGKEKNGVILVDFKFTQKYHRAALEAQLSIYKYLFELQNPKLHVEALYCLWGEKKTRTVKEFIPVSDLGAEWVADLLSCEKDGRVFIDPRETPQAALALTEAEISDVVAKAAKVEELKAAVKEIEAALKGYYDRVRDYMLEHNLEEMEADGGVFKLKKAYERTSIDTDAVKRIAPELYTQCSKTTTVAASVSFKKS
ncbi:MAG: hypothetical protein IJP77_11785 [Bacteroidales bacterium]|nr:hypothetical protein [Bacteroidales bacterium]